MADGQSASVPASASYSCRAAARAARRPSGSWLSGTSASMRAASMRTPRTGSASSGAAPAPGSAGSAGAIMPSAAMRTDGSASCSSLRAAGRCAGLSIGLGQRRRGGAHDRRALPARRRVRAGRQGARALRLGGMQRGAVMRALAPCLAIPFVHGARRPLAACGRRGTGCRHSGCRATVDRSGRGMRRL